MKEAVETEYRGIRFRSKSEAMFALWIDLVDGPLRDWQYEPRIDGPHEFSIDFQIVWVETDGETLDAWTQYWEYKPAKPTKTYIASRKKKWERLLGWGHKEGFFSTYNTRFGIRYGSIWEPKRGSVLFDELGDGADVRVVHTSYDWLSRYEDQIRNYRFDLE